MSHVFLHVENDQLYHELLNQEMEQHGHRLEAVDRADRICSVFDRSREASVIFDVLMDVVDGMQGWRMLMDRHPEARFVFLTNYPQEPLDGGVPPLKVIQKSGSAREDCRLVLESFVAQGLPR